MNSRPDWVRCIGYAAGQSLRTWCGRDERPFFVDVTHAAINGVQQGRLVACRECVAVIVDGLRNGHDDTDYLPIQ